MARTPGKQVAAGGGVETQRAIQRKVDRKDAAKKAAAGKTASKKDATRKPAAKKPAAKPVVQAGTRRQTRSSHLHDGDAEHAERRHRL